MISPLIVISFGVFGRRKYPIKCEISVPTRPLPLVYKRGLSCSVVYNALIPSSLHDSTYGPE